MNEVIMKKLLLGICFFKVCGLMGNLTYDPVLNTFYTLPVSKEINQDEYRMLVIYCIQLQENIRAANSGIYPPDKDLLQQMINYLKQVNTPAAKRLIEDLKKDKIYYPDGSVMRKLSS